MAAHYPEIAASAKRILISSAVIMSTISKFQTEDVSSFHYGFFSLAIRTSLKNFPEFSSGTVAVQFVSPASPKIVVTGVHIFRSKLASSDTVES